MQIYVGPLWGNVQVLENVKKHLALGHCLNFYGGYLHFATKSSQLQIFKNLIDLNSLYPNQINFFLSRFEEEMLIHLKLKPENGHYFRRWFNPFSGISSYPYLLTGSIQQQLLDPDEGFLLLEELLKNIGFYDFCKLAKIDTFPTNIELTFIENLNADLRLGTLSLIDDDLKLVDKIDCESNLDQYIKMCEVELGKYSGESFKFI